MGLENEIALVTGATRGIDSSFVVTARLANVGADDSLEVILWLVAGAMPRVVRDSEHRGPFFGGREPADVVAGAAGFDRLEPTVGPQITGGEFVVVQQKRGRDPRAFAGDADSVTISDGAVTEVTWYGRVHESSPTVDAIAAEGVRFVNYYTSDAPCLPSRTALYSGRFGIQTGVVAHGGTNAVLLTHLLDVRPVPWEWMRFESELASYSVAQARRISEPGHVWSLQNFNEIGPLRDAGLR